MAVTEREEVFEARMQSAPTMVSSLAPLGEPAERLHDRLLRFLRRPGLGVEHHGAHAALGEYLDDAAAHGAGPGNAGHKIRAGNV
jgi:hypothetical protein